MSFFSLAKLGHCEHIHFKIWCIDHQKEFMVSNLIGFVGFLIVDRKVATTESGCFKTQPYTSECHIEKSGKSPFLLSDLFRIVVQPIAWEYLPKSLSALSGVRRNNRLTASRSIRSCCRSHDAGREGSAYRNACLP